MDEKQTGYANHRRQCGHRLNLPNRIGQDSLPMTPLSLICTYTLVSLNVGDKLSQISPLPRIYFQGFTMGGFSCGT